MKFFLPDWDDRVDPGYDFLTDRATYGRNAYRDDLYAHEYFGDQQPYDGLLISRSALAADGPKRELIERVGFRRFFRLPSRFELLGDCGAFGYIYESRPPFSTAEILDYYARLGVDYGVSVDHIAVPEFPDQRQARHTLTIENALEFLAQHRATGAQFTPIGAVQGWDAPSYIEAAQRLAAAGYSMLAIGGLARLRTADVQALVAAVAGAVDRSVRLHVLGIARESLVPYFMQLGIFSFDSASPLRSAWTSATRNYFGARRDYLALRIPFSNPVHGVRGDNIVSRGSGNAPLRELESLERRALDAVRAYGRYQVALDDALAAVLAYDAHLSRRSPEFTSERRREAYRRTLTDRPWERCRCRVCKTIGIEVVIFRGTNRNRRRGYHNTITFYERLRAQRRIARGADA